MARSRPARVTKRSSERLRNRLSAGTHSTAELSIGEESFPDMMNFTDDNSHLHHAIEVANTTGSPEAVLSAISQETEAMGEDAQEFTTSPQKRDKGKGRAVDEPEERQFAFMDLPTELRLEIYRACLTRPDKILLSKTMEVPQESAEVDQQGASDIWVTDVDGSTAAEERQNNIAAFQRMRAFRGLPPRNGAASNRAARPGNQPRPFTVLTRTTGHRRRQSHTVRFSSAAAPSAMASSSRTIAIPTMNAQVNPTAGYYDHPLSVFEPHKTAKSEDPLIVNILRTSKAVYKEARSVLYSENIFDLSIDTAVPTLAALHQRSRRLIRNAELEIPSYTEIQDKFSEVVRLSLRYCSGLRSLTIYTPFCLPGGDGNTTPNSNTQIWAQGFDILRWLPQQCDVVLKGNLNAEIAEVVDKHLRLAKTLSPVAYAHRQLIPSDSDRSAQTAS